jgi:hypothetical protein
VNCKECELFLNKAAKMRSSRSRAKEIWNDLVQATITKYCGWHAINRRHLFLTILEDLFQRSGWICGSVDLISVKGPLFHLWVASFSVFSYIVEWKSLVSSVFHKAKNLIMET